MRLLITGPESTGKTTLAQELSTRLSIGLLPEYGRIYLEKYGPDYAYDDISIMARHHHQMYHAIDEGDDLILDTYLLNYQIWSEVKYGRCDPWIQDQVQLMKVDLALLLYPDIDWKPDPLRESEGERMNLFRRYESGLSTLGMSYAVVKGLGKDRVAKAMDVINSKP